jgi:hypothetical protein
VDKKSEVRASLHNTLQAFLDLALGVDQALEVRANIPPTTKTSGDSSASTEQTAPSPFPQVRQTQDGRIEVPLTMPMHLPSEVTLCHMTVFISPEDLRKLAAVDADRHKLGEALHWQCYLADVILSGQQQPLLSPLQRGRVDAIVKRGASIIAKLIHPSVKYQLSHPETQTPVFRRVLQAVKETHNPSPHATDITAWTVEKYMVDEEWDSLNLRHPTAHVGRFAKEYLYIRPKVPQDEYFIALSVIFMEKIVKEFLPS